MNKIVSVELALVEIIESLLRDSKKFLSVKELAGYIRNELLIRGIEISEWKIRILLKERFNSELNTLVRRRVDLYKIILRYRKKHLYFDSIKDLASHISKEYGLNSQSVYSRLLFLADNDDEVGEYLRSIKFKRRENWIESLLFLITLITEGKKVVPLLPCVLRLKEESIEVIASLIFNIQTMGYKITRKKGKWFLVKEK